MKCFESARLCTRARFRRLSVSPASPYLRARHERQRRDLTLKALALLSGLTTAEISLIETGRLTPTPAQLEKLARAFGIAPASVLLKPVTVTDPDEVNVETSEPVAVESSHAVRE
jgi:transcriptional regulator with XRE-family HTH domain